MQLFKSEALVEGQIYSACLCDKTIGNYKAIKPLGKSYLSLLKVGGKHDIPPDFFDWWTSSKDEVPALEARYAEEWAKVEEVLRKRRKTRVY